MELGKDRYGGIVRVVDVQCCYCTGKNTKEKIYIQQQRSERMMTNTGTSPAIITDVAKFYRHDTLWAICGFE